jgi:hypothetical protein
MSYGGGNLGFLNQQKKTPNNKTFSRGLHWEQSSKVIFQIYGSVVSHNSFICFFP